MQPNLEASPQEQTLASLITGILTDASRLVSQEITLAKHEMQETLAKTKTALVALAIGVPIALLGLLLLVLTLVHVLHEVVGLPLWASYGIIALLAAAAGGALLYKGISGMKEVHIVPAKTVETVKENVQWFKEMAMSNRT